MRPSILDESIYLCNKGYFRAAAVLLGAALEEGLKSRARAASLEVGPKETLNPIIVKLMSQDVGIITKFEAKQLESIAKMRNDAAHGGDFNYSKTQVKEAQNQVEATLRKLLGSA